MAYVSKEKKAKIAEALKKVVPKDWKYTLAVDNHSTIVMTIQSAPVDLIALSIRKPEHKNGGYLDTINQYWLEHEFEGETLKTMEAIKAALNTDNHDKSDIQSDYFDVGHYVNIKIGKWGKPFMVTEETIKKTRAPRKPKAVPVEVLPFHAEAAPTVECDRWL